MRILICDDEPAMVKQISEIIADAYPDIELVGVHSSAESCPRSLRPRTQTENSTSPFSILPSATRAAWISPSLSARCVPGSR